MQRFTMSSKRTLIFFSGSNRCSLDWFKNHRCHLSWCNSHRGDHRSHCNRSDSWSANLNNFLSYIHRINLTCIVYNSYIRLWSWCWRIVWTSSIIIDLNIGIMMGICLIILNSSCVVNLRWTVGIRSVLILLWLVFKMITIALNWNFRAHCNWKKRQGFRLNLVDVKTFLSEVIWLIIKLTVVLTLKRFIRKHNTQF